MKAPENAVAVKEASIEIDASPDVVYALVADLPRMGEWSPEATGGEWMDAGTGAVGDWFTGTNKAGEREWSRDCQVASAEPGRDFTFMVGGIEANLSTWSYEMEPLGSERTRLTERFWFVNMSPALAAATDEQVAGRLEQNQAAIEQTLAAIKATAESA